MQMNVVRLALMSPAPGDPRSFVQITDCGATLFPRLPPRADKRTAMKSKQPVGHIVNQSQREKNTHIRARSGSDSVSVLTRAMSRRAESGPGWQRAQCVPVGFPLFEQPVSSGPAAPLPTFISTRNYLVLMTHRECSN